MCINLQHQHFYLVHTSTFLGLGSLRLGSVCDSDHIGMWLAQSKSMLRTMPSLPGWAVVEGVSVSTVQCEWPSAGELAGLMSGILLQDEGANHSGRRRILRMHWEDREQNSVILSYFKDSALLSVCAHENRNAKQRNLWLANYGKESSMTAGKKVKIGQKRERRTWEKNTVCKMEAYRTSGEGQLTSGTNVHRILDTS